MKLLPALLLAVSCAFAQEIQQVPAETAVKIARKLAAALGSPADVPFAVDADAEKSAGIKASEEIGLLAIPDRKLTPESVTHASGTPSAMG